MTPAKSGSHVSQKESSDQQVLDDGRDENVELELAVPERLPETGEQREDGGATPCEPTNRRNRWWLWPLIMILGALISFPMALNFLRTWQRGQCSAPEFPMAMYLAAVYGGFLLVGLWSHFLRRRADGPSRWRIPWKSGLLLFVIAATIYGLFA